MRWCGPSSVSERRHDDRLWTGSGARAVFVRLPAVRTAARGAFLIDVNTMFGVLLTAFLAIVVLCVKPLGGYIAAVMHIYRPRQGPPTLAVLSCCLVDGLHYCDYHGLYAVCRFII